MLLTRKEQLIKNACNYNAMAIKIFSSLTVNNDNASILKITK